MLNIIQIIWCSSHNHDVKYRVVLDRKYLTTYSQSNVGFKWGTFQLPTFFWLSGWVTQECAHHKHHCVHCASGCWVTSPRVCSTRRHVQSMWKETRFKMCVAWLQLGRAVNAGNYWINPDLVCLRIQISLSASPVLMYSKVGLPEVLTYCIYDFGFCLTVSEIPNHPRLNLSGSL